MKKRLRVQNTGRKHLLRGLTLLYLGLLACSSLVIRPSFAQQTGPSQATDVPRVISYQGVLSTATGQLVPDGKYPVTLKLYSDAQGTGYVWTDKYEVNVKGGVFTVLLGSGSSPLPRLVTIDQPLWVGVTVGNQAELRPLTAMSSVPYALNVPDNSITAKKMATDFVGKLSVNEVPISTKGQALNLQSGSGIDLNFDQATNSLLFNLSNTVTGKGGVKTQAWIGGVPPCDFDNVVPTDAVGWPSNSIIGTAGSPIGYASMLGGWTNAATGDFSTLGGGAENNATGCGSFVGGGGILPGNCVIPPSQCPPMPPGPFYNGNTAAGVSSVVGGGAGNNANFDLDVIGGGQGNTTGTLLSFVGGGRNNISGATGITSTVGGGENNKALGDGAAITGGEVNTATDIHSSICGGFNNTTLGAVGHQHIGGGMGNTANAGFTTIGGGQMNVTNTDWSFVGGGRGNIAGTVGNFTTIGGGDGNTAQTNYSTAVGGQTNLAQSDWAFVGGGHNNIAGSGIAGQITQTVGGGENNKALGDGAAICGGESNTANDIHSSITGGIGNTTLGMMGHQHIGGGMGNIANAGFTTIGGGQQNITNNDWATVAGGFGNVAGGGAGMFGITQTVGGGDHNSALGDGATVAGGEHNTANSMHDFIGGGIGNVTVAPAFGCLATHNVISGGGQNTTNGQYSTIPGGLQGQTRDWGQMTNAAGSFAAQGDAQTSVFVLRNNVPAMAPATSLFLNGANQRITVPANGAMALHILIIGKAAGCGAALPVGGWEITVFAKDACGAGVAIGAPNVTVIGALPIGWGAVAVVPGPPNACSARGTVDIQITGAAIGIGAVDYVASVRTSEVIF
ncbi:MAG: hypothetical protein ABI778_01150 [Ignavibacteriota bacterium]